GGDGGGGGLVILLVIVGVLVLVVFLVVRSSKKRSEKRAADELEAARAEVKSQLDAMANDILELADRVRVAEAEAAQDHYEAASATYTEASDAYENAQSFEDFEKLFTKLDTATWQLDAAEALVEGKPVPDKPAPRETSRCFFDPAHRGPFEDAELETAAGKRSVRVCRVDADKLRRGESPQPRMVQVGRRRVPVGAAPRSRGGGGFSGLDAFSILVGGMASGLPQAWGSSRRTRSTARPSRRSRSGFSRPSRTRSSSRSSRSRTSRSRSSRSRSRSSGRSRTGRRRRR
ncbi:MAG: hypothetical protein MI725_07360, partial [Pirellulales bacterium]|nr:hypothetical protein [Pirellulales bacterium]